MGLDDRHDREKADDEVVVDTLLEVEIEAIKQIMARLEAQTHIDFEVVVVMSELVMVEVVDDDDELDFITYFQFYKSQYYEWIKIQ